MNVFSCCARGLSTFHSLEIEEHPERIAPSTNALVQNQNELDNSTNEKIQRIYETFASCLQWVEEEKKSLPYYTVIVPFNAVASLCGTSLDELCKVGLLGEILSNPQMRPEIISPMLDKLSFDRPPNPVVVKEIAYRKSGQALADRYEGGINISKSCNKSEIIAKTCQEKFLFLGTPSSNPLNQHVIFLTIRRGNKKISETVHSVSYLDREDRITKDLIDELILALSSQFSKNLKQELPDREELIALTLYPGLSSDSLNSIAGHPLIFSETMLPELVGELIESLNEYRNSWLLQDSILSSHSFKKIIS